MSMDEVEGPGGDGGKGTTFGEGAAACVLRKGHQEYHPGENDYSY